MTEREHLERLIEDINIYARDVLGDSVWNRWQGFYFPAISMAYAYEPTGLKKGEELSPKFKKHNWFLAPAGITLRLQVWWHVAGDTYNIFTKAKQKGVWSFSPYVMWTSTHGSVYYGNKQVFMCHSYGSAPKIPLGTFGRYMPYGNLSCFKLCAF
jgi:hypothetical protein